MSMHKSFAAAVLYLMSVGYSYSGPGGNVLKNDVNSVVVVKSSSGYWLVKSL
jgi:hypothetical protein